MTHFSKDAPTLCEAVTGLDGGCNCVMEERCDCIFQDREGREWWVRVDPFTGIAFSFPMKLIPEEGGGGMYEDSTPTLYDFATAIGRSHKPRRRPFVMRDIRQAVRDLEKAARMPVLHLRRFAFRVPIHPKVAAVLLENRPHSRTKKRKYRHPLKGVVHWCAKRKEKRTACGRPRKWPPLVWTLQHDLVTCRTCKRALART